MSINSEEELLIALKKEGKSFADYREVVSYFKRSRNWGGVRANHVITSIMIELAELAEHYQWDDDKYKNFNEQQKKAVGFEFVDVFVYLFELAYITGIDLEQMFNEKIPKLAEKYPPGISNQDYNKAKDNYRKTGKNKLYK